MLLIDDLILSPGKFVFWILRQVHEAAEKELDHEAERLTAELGAIGAWNRGRSASGNLTLANVKFSIAWTN